jgi:sugar phosphate isomerase/epimerase
MPQKSSDLPQISSHLGYFGSGGDRYCLGGYQEAVPSMERLRLVAKVEGLDGVELNYPALVTEETAADVRHILEEEELACSNVSMNVWGQAVWGLGSLSNPDPSIRRQAVETISKGMQVAKQVGSSLVSLWPGQDGFDYPFQVDYAAQVDWFVEGLQACADSDPGVRICIEYKPKEPRTHILTDTCARTMWLIEKMDRPNVGVLLDVGHGLFANENVAQSAVLLQREGLLDLVHFNDNYGDWDWDMIPGTIRFWELLELIFWLRESGYSGWYSIDIAMPRGDPVKACQQSVTNTARLFRLVDQLDVEQIRANFQATHHPENLRLLSDQIFGALLKDE